MENIKILKTFFKVSDFVSWKKQGSLNLSPNFQRRPVWQPGAKSYLIDTIVRNLPIPIIFLRDCNTDLNTLELKREVVDGQQRIRTIISYIKPSLLEDYDENKDDFVIKSNHNKEIAGKKFDELDDKYKRTILDYQFDVHILPSDIEDREVYDIFRRMNATGVKLNEQELRNAQFYGDFKTAMYDLASEQLNKWQEWGLFTNSDIARMREVEFISDLAIFIKYGIKQKNSKVIDDIYKYYEEQEDLDDGENIYLEIEIIKSRFRSVINTIDDLIGDKINSTLYKNKTLFYSLFVNIYDIQFGIESSLKKGKANVVSKDVVPGIIKCSDLISSSKAPIDVLNSYERRTTGLGSRKMLVDFLKNKIK